MAFDLRTHIYNKEGKVVSTNFYRRVVDKNGVQYERPVNSGIWYNEDGTISRDESKAVREALEAKQAAIELQAKIELEAKVKAEREALKAELLAEIAAEQVVAKKAGHSGHSSKA